MSSSAIVLQDRTAIPSVTGTVFQITATVSDAGTLPDNGFFLLQIGAHADPTTDTFARVATLSDYAQISASGYGLNRWNAIAQGQTYFRSPTMSIIFNDINTATAGQTSLNNNIDALVNAYEAFSTSFQTQGPDVIYYPTSDPSILSGLITNWQTAQTNTAVAQTAAATAAATLSQSQSNLNNAQNLLSVITNINTNVVVPAIAAANTLLDNETLLESQITNALAQLGTAPGGFPNTSTSPLVTNLFTAISALLYSVRTDLPFFPTSPAQTDLSNAYNNFVGTGSPPAGAQIITNLYTILSAAFLVSPTIPSTNTVTTALQAAQMSLQSASNSFNSAAANAAITAQNLLAAQNTENTALAAIVAVAPCFDPSNPTALLS